MLGPAAEALDAFLSACVCAGEVRLTYKGRHRRSVSHVSCCLSQPVKPRFFLSLSLLSPNPDHVVILEVESTNNITILLLISSTSLQTEAI